MCGKVLIFEPERDQQLTQNMRPFFCDDYCE